MKVVRIPAKFQRPLGLACCATSLAYLAQAEPALAAVTLPSVFSDHMVVQREMPVPVWGTAEPGEAVQVSLGAEQAAATAGADGKWMVRLAAQPAGGPFELSVSGANRLDVQDVFIGEVWLASGQSNMDYRVHCTFAGCALQNEAAEVAAADHPLIRSANVPYAPSATPAESATTSWLVSSPATAPEFSAAGYFFARELAANLPGVAVGIIHGSFGASTIQCWMPREALLGIPSVADRVGQFEANNPDFRNQHNPYICYNGQISPIVPYAIRGVIWAQGESVTWGGDTYRDLQVGLIDSWRAAWGQDLTFLVTQLANYNVSSGAWPVLREAQLQATQMIPNTGLAVTIDLGEATNVHYGDKQDLGLRLGLAARAITYGQTTAYSGPLYDHMEVEGNAIRLHFLHAENGLAFKGGAGTGFEVAGADDVYAVATARIDGDTIVVSSPGVAAPETARYAWAGFPAASLFSSSTPALPASPFRTDAPPAPVREVPAPPPAPTVPVDEPPAGEDTGQPAGGDTAPENGDLGTIGSVGDDSAGDDAVAALEPDGPAELPAVSPEPATPSTPAITNATGAMTANASSCGLGYLRGRDAAAPLSLLLGGFLISGARRRHARGGGGAAADRSTKP
jgi:sialate O-acetylesterase